jgi:hypothetical protein
MEMMAVASTLREVEQLVSGLTFDERGRVLENLARSLRTAGHSGAPERLWELWKDRFPEDIDLDAGLADIRAGWSTEPLP